MGSLAPYADSGRGLRRGTERSPVPSRRGTRPAGPRAPAQPLRPAHRPAHRPQAHPRWASGRGPRTALARSGTLRHARPVERRFDPLPDRGRTEGRRQNSHPEEPGPRQNRLHAQTVHRSGETVSLPVVCPQRILNTFAPAILPACSFHPVIRRATTPTAVRRQTDLDMPFERLRRRPPLPPASVPRAIHEKPRYPLYRAQTEPWKELLRRYPHQCRFGEQVQAEPLHCPSSSKSRKARGETTLTPARAASGKSLRFPVTRKSALPETATSMNI
jgi:hypothetical protein